MATISKYKRPLILSLGLLLLAVTLTGCSGSVLGNANWPGISANETNVFISLGPHVYAVDIEKGNEVCRFPEEPQRGVNFFAPALPINENLVIVGDFSGTIYGFDSSNDCEGSWEEEVSNDFIIGGPVVYNNTVLIPSADGTLYAYEFNSNSIDFKWKYETKSSLWSSPLVSGDVIYQSSMDHHVYALNAQNGTLIWEEDVSSAILDTPTESENLLLVGTFGNQLIALNKERGGVEWSFETKGWVWGNPIVIDGVAYFGDIEGNVYFVNTDSGREAMSSETVDGAITSSPVVSEGLVYFGTATGTLYARTPSDFSPGWKREIEGGLYVDAIVQEDRMYLSVLSETDPLLALRVQADASADLWSFAPEE